MKKPEEFFDKDAKKSDIFEEAKRKIAEEEEKPQCNDPHWWLLNEECSKCGRVYCDCDSKY